MEQYLRGAARRTGFGENRGSCQSLKSLTTALDEHEANPSVGFECNICLDLVQDPVVTLCGHLYCWPCIYKWISFQNDTPDNLDQPNPQCPVCKTEVSEKTLIPLYGRGQTTKAGNKDGNKAGLSQLIIPQRPATPRRWNNVILPNFTTTDYSNPSELLQRRSYPPPSPRPSYPPPSPRPDYNSYTPSPIPRHGSSSPHLADPMIGMFGEMVFARIFGNSETTTYAYPDSYYSGGSSSPRLRRHMVQTDKSLSRLCFFFFCCMILCLLLF